MREEERKEEEKDREEEEEGAYKCRREKLKWFLRMKGKMSTN